MSTPRLSPTEALEKFQSAIQASIEAARAAAFTDTETGEAERIINDCIEDFARELYEPATEQLFECSEAVETVIHNIDLGPREEDSFRERCYEAADSSLVSIYHSEAQDFMSCNTSLCDNAAQEFGIEFDANEGLHSFISKCAAYGLMLDVSGGVSSVFNAFQNNLEEELNWLYDLRDDLEELEEDQEI